MRKSGKLLLLGTAAALVMAFAASTASAGRLSISHGELVRNVWSSLEFKGGLAATKCPVTLESSFHYTSIVKSVGALIGLVTRAIVGSCTQGSATVLAETLPWHIQYGGFNGTLPRFTGVKELLIGASFRIQEPVFGINCLSTTTTENPSVGIAEEIAWEARGNGIIRTLKADGTARIPCGAISGSFEGTATVTENAGATNVLIRLI